MFQIQIIFNSLEVHDSCRLEIMRYLLSKNNKRSRDLFFFHAFQKHRKIRLRELKMFIKFVNRDLYL